MSLYSSIARAATFKRFTTASLSFLDRPNCRSMQVITNRAFVYLPACNTIVFYHTNNGIYGHPARISKQKTGKYSLKPVPTGIHGLLAAYRRYGYHRAKVDPLNLSQSEQNIMELDPILYGLSAGDVHDVKDLIYHPLATNNMTTSQVVDLLDNIYCGTMAIQFDHVATHEERAWIALNFEALSSQSVASSRKVEAAKLMLRAEAFDHFLAGKFGSVKRYGGEGAESAMVFYQELFHHAAPLAGVKDIVMCIAHRGRLNLLTCLLKYPPTWMFGKMKGLREFPPTVQGSGDVLSHLTSSVDLLGGSPGDQIHVTLLPNPSHLEAANPVAAGKTRARMQSRGVGDYGGVDNNNSVLCFQVHGDAAFVGQGIVAETFELAYTPNFNIGGTMHLIINNQVGYTTQPDRGRSTEYAGDLGKIISCPVIQVNAEEPNQVMKACQLATQYRATFSRDVIVDYVCYRKWGHNELDEPSFTQPIMYQAIRDRPASIPALYAERLLAEGLCNKEELAQDTANWVQELTNAMGKYETEIPKACHLEKQWEGLVQASTSEITTWDTGVNLDMLRYVGGVSVSTPSGFNVHPTLQRGHIQRRRERLIEGKGIDWATAEALAMGSLLLQGYGVRLCGQDVGRGTFSQRHAMFVDQKTDEAFIPLNSFDESKPLTHSSQSQPAFLELANSLLSEEAVLGFEYGFSVENPRVLVIWEAQFGDFFNGAQIIIDTFITGGETKWLLQSPLTLILPHGMDGAGPEHSSCRVERFLQCSDSSENRVDADSVNIQICNPTQPSQYFHLLRRQMVRNFRKPLIVVGPKLLLRHPDAVSNLSEFEPGTTFQPVLDDPNPESSNATRVVFLSGKHYYTLEKERRTRKEAGDKSGTSLALVRLESLSPFPAGELQRVLGRYKNAKDFVWAQEEHRNAGAWGFVAPRFENVVGRRLRYIGRDTHATPATGVGRVHQEENKYIVNSVFE